MGDRVLLKLRLYHQIQLAKRLSNKLARRYYGPFLILERIGKVAYRVELPSDSKLHPLFHVSLLKPFRGEIADTSCELPAEVFDDSPIHVPLMECGHV